METTLPILINAEVFTLSSNIGLFNDYAFKRKNRIHVPKKYRRIIKKLSLTYEFKNTKRRNKFISFCNKQYKIAGNLSGVYTYIDIIDNLGLDY